MDQSDQVSLRSSSPTELVCARRLREEEKPAKVDKDMNAQNAELRQGRSAIKNEVEEFARECLEAHIEECKNYALQRIRAACEGEKKRLTDEDSDRLSYLESLNPDAHLPAGRSVDTRMRIFACAKSDPALAAIDNIVHDFQQRSSRDDYDLENDRSVLPFIDNVPKYDAWVPVRTNFWVGKDMELEPYMPYFGDDNEGRSKAFDLYKDMAQDAKQENQLSDGEVNDIGELIEPNSERAWVKYEGLGQVRWRSGCRDAIMKAFEIYDETAPHVLDGLSAGLDITDRRRLKAVIKVAKSRHDKLIQDIKAREKRSKLRNQVRKAMKSPTQEPEVLEEGTWTSRALKNFCFTCQLFHCRQHLGRDVEPTMPIADPTVDEREKLIHTDKINPCSTVCFLMKNWKQKPKDAVEDKPWTPDEIMALREATAVFRKDPCNLSVVVGSRTCREIMSKLEEPGEEARMRRAITESKKKRTVNSKLKSQRMADNRPRDNDSDVEDIDIVEVGAKKKSKSQRKPPTVSKKAAHKGLESSEQANENEDFLPCYHNGPCTVDTCHCVKRGLDCESTCACNNARYGIGPNKRGIARYSHGARCSNAPTGCHCKKGHCNTAKCSCWADNRACNPDICEECDCKILPSQLQSSSRRCRNVSVSIARHKRTYVGKSPVHGYGLFAGDHFDEGDLVGIYGGQLLDTRLADMVGRLYDAKDHTFFFDITETIVIDGGVLGMKTKFCNHTHSGNPDENCHSKMVRVRGEAHIALFTKRAVAPGEELKFDYKFQSVVPPWAKAPEGTKQEPEAVVVSELPSKTPARRSRSKSKRS